jgi:hypothetical protein
MPAAIGPEKGCLQQTAGVDLKRASCMGDTLDGHRSSLLTFCVPACDTTGDVDLKVLLRGEPTRWS